MLHILSPAAVESLIQVHGYGGIFACLLLGGLGLPLPAETLLLAAGVFAATTGLLDIRLVVAAAAAGSIGGDQLCFLTGRALGQRLPGRWGARLGLTPDRLALARYMISHHGGRLVFFGRYVAFLSTIAAVLAGANGMTWARFTAFSVAGGLSWAALYGFGAFALGDGLERLRGPLGLAFGVVAAVVVAVAALRLRRAAGRIMAEARREAGLG